MENPAYKLILLAAFVPVMLLVHFVAGWMMSPDWVTATVATQILVAVAIAFALIEAGRQLIPFFNDGKSFPAGAAKLVIIGYIVALALSLWVGRFLHHADHPTADPQVEQVREQMRAIEHKKVDIVAPDGTHRSLSPMDPQALELFNEQRMARLRAQSATSQPAHR